MIVYVLLFVLEALIIGLCAFIGYKRGAGKEIVRVVELVIAATAALFLGRWAASTIADELFGVLLATLDAPIRELVELAPETQRLVSSLLGSIIAPFIFVVIFAVLQLFTLIGLSALAKRIFPAFCEQKENGSKKVRWIGAGVGVACGVIVAVAFLSPWYAGAAMVSSVSVKAEEMLAVELGLDKDVFAELPHKDMSLPVASLFVKGVTGFRVEGDYFSAVQETPRLVNLVTDALHAYNESKNAGEPVISSVSAAVSATVAHLQESKYTARLTADVMRAVGHGIKNGNSIIVGETDDRDELMQGVMDSVGDLLTGVDHDNLVDNVTVIVGDKSTGKQGVLSVALDITINENVEDAPKNEEKLDKLADSFMSIASNPKLSNTMKSMVRTSARALNARLPKKGDEKRVEYVQKLSKSVNDVLVATEDTQDDFEKSVSIATEIIRDTVNDTEDLEVTDGELRLLAICAVDYFGTPENYARAGSAPVSIADIEAFFTEHQ